MWSCPLPEHRWSGLTRPWLWVQVRCLLALGGLGVFSRCLFHTIFKTLYSTTKVGAEIAKFFGSEDQQNDQQNNKPMPDAKAAHDDAPIEIGVENLPKSLPDGTALATLETSSFNALKRGLGAKRFGPPKQMNVKMIHLLAPNLTAIDHSAKAVGRAIFDRKTL